jgi:hypothetical protein
MKQPEWGKALATVVCFERGQEAGFRERKQQEARRYLRGLRNPPV